MQTTLRVLVFGLLMFGAAAVAAQKEPLPDAEKRALLLQEAASLTNIWSSHSAPFHLRADVSSFNGKRERKGQFEIWWASPSKFRDQITWGDQTTTHIADGQSLWTDGDDLHRRDTYRVLRLLAFPSHLASADGKSPHAFRKRIDGQPMVCLQMTRTLPPPLVAASSAVPANAACLDESTNLPREITDIGYQYDLSDYAAIGHAWFPKRLRQYTTDNDEIVAIDAQTVEPLDSNFEGFVPRDGLTPQPWCASVKPPLVTSVKLTLGVSALAPTGAITTLQPGRLHEVLLVFSVDATGHPTAARAFDADGEATVSLADRSKLMLWTFQPASCNGTPITGEYLHYGYPLEFAR